MIMFLIMKENRTVPQVLFHDHGYVGLAQCG